MAKIEPFEKYTERYEYWFEKNEYVYQSEKYFFGVVCSIKGKINNI
jgi:hypothetical protein